MKLPDKDDIERRRRIELLRSYTRTMGERISSLRARAEGPAASSALAEVIQELDVTHEELRVADEEIAGAESRFEEARRGLEARLRHYMALFEGSPDGYVLTDPRGMIREGNHAFGVLLGVPRDFLRDKPLVNFVARGDVRTFRGVLASELPDTPGHSRVFSLNLRPRNGTSPFVAEVAVQMVRGTDDQIVSVRWTFRRAPERAAGSSGEDASAREVGDVPSTGSAKEG